MTNAVNVPGTSGLTGVYDPGAVTVGQSNGSAANTTSTGNSGSSSTNYTGAFNGLGTNVATSANELLNSASAFGPAIPASYTADSSALSKAAGQNVTGAAAGYSGGAIAAANPGSVYGAATGKLLNTPIAAQTTSTGAFDDTQAAKYMSPYLSNVVNASRSQYDNTNALQQGQLAARNALGGNFGSSASAGSALLASQQGLAENTALSGLLNAGYTNAQAQYNADQARGLQSQTSNQSAALTAAGLTTQAQQSAAQDALSNSQTNVNAQLGAGSLTNAAYAAQVAGYNTAATQDTNAFNMSNAAKNTDLAAFNDASGALKLGTTSTDTGSQSRVNNNTTNTVSGSSQTQNPSIAAPAGGGGSGDPTGGLGGLLGGLSGASTGKSTSRSAPTSGAVAAPPKGAAPKTDGSGGYTLGGQDYTPNSGGTYNVSINPLDPQATGTPASLAAQPYGWQSSVSGGTPATDGTGGLQPILDTSGQQPNGTDPFGVSGPTYPPLDPLLGGTSGTNNGIPPAPQPSADGTAVTDPTDGTAVTDPTSGNSLPIDPTPPSDKTTPNTDAGGVKDLGSLTQAQAPGLQGSGTYWNQLADSMAAKGVPGVWQPTGDGAGTHWEIASNGMYYDLANAKDGGSIDSYARGLLRQNTVEEKAADGLGGIGIGGADQASALAAQGNAQTPAFASGMNLDPFSVAGDPTAASAAALSNGADGKVLSPAQVTANVNRSGYDMVDKSYGATADVAKNGLGLNLDPADPIMQKALSQANAVSAAAGFGQSDNPAYFYALAAGGGMRGKMIGSGFIGSLEQQLKERNAQFDVKKENMLGQMGAADHGMSAAPSIYNQMPTQTVDASGKAVDPTAGKTPAQLAAMGPVGQFSAGPERQAKQLQIAEGTLSLNNKQAAPDQPVIRPDGTRGNGTAGDNQAWESGIPAQQVADTSNKQMADNAWSMMGGKSNDKDFAMSGPDSIVNKLVGKLQEFNLPQKYLAPITGAQDAAGLNAAIENVRANQSALGIPQLKDDGMSRMAAASEIYFAAKMAAASGTPTQLKQSVYGMRLQHSATTAANASVYNQFQQDQKNPSIAQSPGGAYTSNDYSLQAKQQAAQMVSDAHAKPWVPNYAKALPAVSAMYARLPPAQRAALLSTVQKAGNEDPSASSALDNEFGYGMSRYGADLANDLKKIK